MFEVIIRMAKSYGLDPHTYMTEYFTAASIHGDGVPCRLQEFLPWNMSPQQIERYKRPTPIQFGNVVFPSSAACSAWTKEQIRLEDEAKARAMASTR